MLKTQVKELCNVTVAIISFVYTENYHHRKILAAWHRLEENLCSVDMA